MKEKKRWLQVATATEVYVFHVKHFTPGVMVGASAEIIARSLQPLLPLFTSKHVFKVGVGVQGDVTLLKRFSSNLQCQYVNTHFYPACLLLFLSFMCFGAAFSLVTAFVIVVLLSWQVDAVSRLYV